MSIALDYVEKTGPHLRVGLILTDELDITPADQERLEDAARDLSGLTAVPWDFNITSTWTVEVSFEDES